MFSKTSSAHNVFYFTPPCFLQGATAGTADFDVPVAIGNAGNPTYYHWQYKLTDGTGWHYFATNTGTLTIGTASFTFSNASWKQTNGANSGPGAVLLSPAFHLKNTNAFTTQLDGMQLRILMTDGIDPALGTLNPATQIWGGSEFANGYEAKYITLQSRPSISTPCYTVCPNNRLTTDPGNSNPANATFFGGFEVGSGSGTDNFSTPAANG